MLATVVGIDVGLCVYLTATHSPDLHRRQQLCGLDCRVYDSDSGVAWIVNVHSVNSAISARRSVNNRQQRTACCHLGVVERVEVTSQHDRRRRTRGRHGIDAGLNVVKQRRRLILGFRRMIQCANQRGMFLRLDTYQQKLKLSRVTWTCLNIGRQSTADVYRDAASRTTNSIPTKQRVPVYSDVMISVFLFQVCLGDDRDIDVMPRHIRRQVLGCVWFGNGRSIQYICLLYTSPSPRD